MFALPTCNPSLVIGPEGQNEKTLAHSRLCTAVPRTLYCCTHEVPLVTSAPPLSTQALRYPLLILSVLAESSTFVRSCNEGCACDASGGDAEVPSVPFGSPFVSPFRCCFMRPLRRCSPRVPDACAALWDSEPALAGDTPRRSAGCLWRGRAGADRGLGHLPGLCCSCPAACRRCPGAPDRCVPRTAWLETQESPPSLAGRWNKQCSWRTGPGMLLGVRLHRANARTTVVPFSKFSR